MIVFSHSRLWNCYGLIVLFCPSQLWKHGVEGRKTVSLVTEVVAAARRDTGWMVHHCKRGRENVKSNME